VLHFGRLGAEGLHEISLVKNWLTAAIGTTS